MPAFDPVHCHPIDIREAAPRTPHIGVVIRAVVGYPHCSGLLGL